MPLSKVDLQCNHHTVLTRATDCSLPCVQIKMWDVRVTRPVQQYKGHHNEHAYLPLHVNEPEGLLLAGRNTHTHTSYCLTNILSVHYSF